ncbi:MAG: alpha/beta hydrolase [Candidatus Saccharibacteria bacterium]|nr:alpha/beta hydrolase [Candidatus Saccharibacteria bacterium]
MIAKIPGAEAGELEVSGGHTLHYEIYGEGDTRFVYLPGGPGQPFSPANAELFDPSLHVVAFFDPRGTGESTQANDDILHANTTRHLVGDVVHVSRQVFDDDRVNLAGGSWGSFWAMATAAEMTGMVDNVVTWANFTGVPDHSDYQITSPEIKAFAPMQLDNLLDLVSPEARTNYQQMAQELGAQIQAGGDSAKVAAIRYGLHQLWMARPMHPTDEATANLYGVINEPSINQDMEPVQVFDMAALFGLNPLQEASIALHYYGAEPFCFVGDIYIEDNVDNIRQINGKVHILNGAEDMSTPPSNAVWLHEQIGPDKSTLQIVEDAGHLRSDKNLKAALQAQIAAIAQY